MPGTGVTAAGTNTCCHSCITPNACRCTSGFVHWHCVSYQCSPQEVRLHISEKGKYLFLREAVLLKHGDGLQVTGKGPLAQVGIATGVPISQVSIGLLAFIGFFLVAAVFEGNYGEENKEDYSQY